MVKLAACVTGLKLKIVYSNIGDNLKALCTLNECHRIDRIRLAIGQARHV